jgi:hypothetical protein
MSEPLRLPGLRGDDPLGFLAALGTLRLVITGLGLRAKLGFAPGAVPTALLKVEGKPDSRALAVELEQLAKEMFERGQLLCGVAPEFPPRKQGSSGPDPARLSLSEGLAWGAVAATEAMDGDEALASWLLSLYCQRSNDETTGRLTMTPFYAPSGQMTLAGNFAEPLRIVASKPGHIQAAFTRWRRVDKFTGANLDLRALRDAGVEPGGKPANRGAPGPTWLALEGIGLARVAAKYDPAPSVLWRRKGRHERGRAVAMSWPTWGPLLGPDAIRVLVEHPDLASEEWPGSPQAQTQARRALSSRRRELGVTALWRAERSGLSNSDGPLMAPRRIWPEGDP